MLARRMRSALLSRGFDGPPCLPGVRRCVLCLAALALPGACATAGAAGGEAWVSLNLPPGRYFMSCATPEADGEIHAQKGMIEEFEITRPAS
jgi:hypothetical protein